MKYGKKTIVSVLIAIGILYGSLIAYPIADHRKNKPRTQAVGTAQLTTPSTPPLTQTFSGIEGLKVGYPTRWSAKPGSTNSTDGKQLSVVFEAPHTTTKTHSSGNEQMLTGTRITLYKNSFSKSKNIEEFKKSNSFVWKYAENKKDSTVKDMQVVEFDVSYENPAQHYAVFYKDSTEYMLVTGAHAHKNPNYKAAFENIIKNMEFTK